jgi:four helix bundle protein
MGSITKFEDFEVWQDSMVLCKELYSLLSDCRDFALRDQMQRAAVSIPSNIAEGFERGSNKEFVRFLYIAKGSAGELRTQIYLAKEFNIIDKEKSLVLMEKIRKISGMLQNLIKTRKENFK